MSTKTFTAIIADDEALLRDELSDILTELWPKCEIVAEAADGFHALELIEQHKPDIAFLDIKMPRMTGLEAVENVSTDTYSYSLLPSTTTQLKPSTRVPSIT